MTESQATLVAGMMGAAATIFVGVLAFISNNSKQSLTKGGARAEGSFFKTFVRLLYIILMFFCFVVWFYGSYTHNFDLENLGIMSGVVVGAIGFALVAVLTDLS